MRVYPIRPKDREREEDRKQREKAKHEAVFEDEFDDASSIATRWTLRSSIGKRSSVSLGGLSYVSNVDRARARRRIRKVKNVHEDLNTAIRDGWVEANLYHMSTDEILELFTKVTKRADCLESLRLLCLPREFEIPWEQRNRPELEVPYYKYGRRPHRLMAREFADRLLDNTLRVSYTAMIKHVMRPAFELVMLELGVAMSDTGMESLGQMLSKNTTIERLSFSGSCMGDHAITLLKDGLICNKTLKELDLTGCALTDVGAKMIARLLKNHSSTRGTCFWQEMLREYPNDNDGEMKERLYERVKTQVFSRVAAQQGGLLLLELRHNKIGDDAVAMLYDAVLFDTRLMQVGLSRNKVSLFWQERFAKLLKDHISMQQIDLRGNRSSYMGILRRRPDGAEVMLHLPVVKRNLPSWNGIPIARAPVKDIFVLSLDDVLDTPREDCDGLDSHDGTQNNLSGGELSELMGDIEDPGLVSAQTSARATAGGRDSGTEGSDAAVAFPSVPRLKFNFGGQVVCPVREAKKPAVAKKNSGQQSKQTGVSESIRVRKAETDIIPSNFVRKTRRGKTPTQKMKKALKSARGRPKDDNSEVVKEMSAVLLQLHQLVTQFEDTATREPLLVPRLESLRSHRLLQQQAPRPNTRLALLEIAGQLKERCDLDDSNVWTARNTRAPRA